MLAIAVATPALGQSPLIRQAGVRDGAIVLEADVHALRVAAAKDRRFIVECLALDAGTTVDLQLERFNVVAPGARILLGTKDGDVPAPFDASECLFVRGEVVGHPGSHVFLAFTGPSSAGRIELGPGRGAYSLSSRGAPSAQHLGVVETRTLGGISLPCATDTGEHEQDPIATIAPSTPVRGLRQAELAVEGDYELFTLFDTEVEAIAYMLQVYGAASDIMMRDLAIRMDVVFLRLWTTPDDPWGDGAHWAMIPGGVQHDVSQLLSGTRDVGAGGLAVLCGKTSWIGFALGAFVDPTYSNMSNQDIIIAAHELGHNFGSPHDHDLGVNDCDDPNTPTLRGAIVSYCYYFSGGYANTDMRYHVAEQTAIRNCLSNKPQFVYDCNQNGRDDLVDIAMGTSFDLNANEIPDECEDCNANGMLDSDDIAMGLSADLNGNGIPDECEPDCNGNGMPDDLDIMLGVSTDEHGNGIPDECEADCNDNGVSDYTEIQLDMTLDIDRNAVLDSCQDCDLDGIPDIVALDGANSIWAISSGDATLREYHPLTGVLMRTAEAGHLADPQDVLITGDARILVSSAGDDDHVAEFDRTGTFVRTLVASGAGGLDDPGAMLATKDGRLLVAGRASSNVLAYDLGTGVFMGELVSPDEANPVGPYGLALAPNGHLLVGTADHKVLEYDSKTGELIRELVPAKGGGLLSPRDLLVLSDHRLLVASEDLGHILAYDADSGRFLGQFDYGQFGDGLAGAWGLAMAGDGYVYVTSSEQPEQFHLTDPRMLMYDTDNGWLIRTIVQRPDSQLAHPHGVDFMPGDGDCNRNLLPDACDIASGASADANGNEVPDECENLCPADINGDGALNVLDFVAFQLAWQDHDPSADCNDDGSFDITDFVCYQVLYQAGCD
jgi:hypothetical protein